MPNSNQPTDTIDLPAITPSWIDRFEWFIERLSPPYWISCLLLGIALVGFSFLIQKLESPSTIFQLDPFVGLSIFQAIYFFYLMHYLDEKALMVLAKTKPGLRIEEDEIPIIEDNLTKLPASSTLRLTFVVLLVIGALVILDLTIIPEQSLLFDYDPATPGLRLFNFMTFYLVWLVNVLFLYHLLRQSNTIDHILTHHTEINLFRQRDIYAFSTHSARATIGFILPPLLWIWLDPGVSSLLIAAFFAFLGLFAFLYPLIGIHRQLEDRKQDLLDQIGILMEDAIAQLLNWGNERNEATRAESTVEVSSLDEASDLVKGISTWPWETDTIRRVIVAIMLPLLLWLTQFFLSRWLTP